MSLDFQCFRFLISTKIFHTSFPLITNSLNMIASVKCSELLRDRLFIEQHRSLFRSTEISESGVCCSHQGGCGLKFRSLNVVVSGSLGRYLICNGHFPVPKAQVNYPVIVPCKVKYGVRPKTVSPSGIEEGICLI